MALDAGIVWEIRADGSQNNGGGFKTGAAGVDKSQQAAAEWALDPVTSAGATAVMTNANAHADMIGNTCRVVSGANATVGWYEVIAVNAGVDLTVDRNWCTGACGNGVVNVGGAFALGGLLDDDFGSAVVAGNIIYIKSGNHSLGENVTWIAAGTALIPRVIIGYDANRNTVPIGDNRPLIGGNNFGFRVGAFWRVSNIRFTDIFVYTFQEDGDCVIVNCKAANTSAVANRAAFNRQGTPSTYIGCEGMSIAGYAFNMANACRMFDCYGRDSKVGFYGSGTNQNELIGCIADTCQTGIDFVLVNWNVVRECAVRNCVIGINGGTSYGNHFTNNIIADCVTGASWGAEQAIDFWDFNCWSNNTTDVSNVTKGPNDVTADALFNAATVKGVDGATDGAGTAFTAATNPFAGVTTDDFLNIVEIGTGATLGVYTIAVVVGNGELTLGRSAGANKANIDYCIVKGVDFGLAAGSPAKDVGLDVETYTSIAIA